MVDEDGNNMLPTEFLPVTNLIGSGEEFDKVIVSMAIINLEKMPIDMYAWLLI